MTIPWRYQLLYWLVGLAVCALLATGAHAGPRGGHGGAALWGPGWAIGRSWPLGGAGGGSYVEHLTPQEQADRAKRWESYCRPVIGPPDSNGIRRYSYTDRRCENGYAGD
jgi:hypothetical protein